MSDEKACLNVAEWIKLELSGQQCEPLQLDEEDRRRIEEIKRELLLKNPIKVIIIRTTLNYCTLQSRQPPYVICSNVLKYSEL